MRVCNNTHISCYFLYFYILILEKKNLSKTKLTKEQCYNLKGVGGNTLLQCGIELKITLKPRIIWVQIMRIMDSTYSPLTYMHDDLTREETNNVKETHDKGPKKYANEIVNSVCLYTHPYLKPLYNIKTFDKKRK